MKTLLTAWLLFFTFISFAQSQTATSIAPSPEESSIRKTIEDETTAFMTRDQQKWSDAWMHTPYVSWSSERSPSQILGWDKMNDSFAYNFVAGQAPRATLNFERDNLQINVLDNTATASFTQTAKAADGRLLGKSREIRVLEKKDKDWKLIYVYSRTIR